jgi:hypothetical protein
MTQQVADDLSAGITAHPEDWHMLQRVFVADLRPFPPPTPTSPPDQPGGASTADAASAADRAPVPGTG